MFAVYAECGPWTGDDDKLQPRRNPPPFEDFNTFPYKTSYVSLTETRKLDTITAKTFEMYKVP
ncbi:hypothetical protein Bhyg_09507 [Pseudolycoriella hygida]|uniref:Uncharacterized protein n=1 Tax=Pseudolycoriella hygida TaxID=35572 RepID=A0A9Q0N6N9_9DIPT|nr:hypothetical protein Bhyg_09507 [Pseudolycoriella hygida]